MKTKQQKIVSQILESGKVISSKELAEQLQHFCERYIRKQYFERWQWKLVNLKKDAYLETRHRFEEVLSESFIKQRHEISESLFGESVIAYSFMGVGMRCSYIEAAELFYGNDHICMFTEREGAVFYSHEDEWWVSEE